MVTSRTSPPRPSLITLGWQTWSIVVVVLTLLLLAGAWMLGELGLGA